MAEVRHAFVRRKMLDDLVDGAPDGDPGFNTQAASLFPWLALDPADVAEQIAIAPSFDVHIEGKDSFQRTVQHDLKIKRLHGACNGRGSAGAMLRMPPTAEV